MRSQPRIALLDSPERSAWYADLCREFHADWLEGTEIAFRDSVRHEIDLAIVNDERKLPEVSAAVCELRRRQVPTLHLVDGVAEWRNIWENPNFQIGDVPAVPMFQPVLCHKVACLGRAQARLFEAWGNGGKCEIVGMPRFDRYLNITPRTPGESRRVLVMTAKNPAFTPNQTERVRNALGDLKHWFESHPVVDGISIQPVWRLTQNWERELEVENRLGDFFGLEFFELLQSCDALITTPSTSVLEGMLSGMPVATIDYNNSPPFTPCAWSITAPDHVDEVIRAILDPPKNRMLHQDFLLHDALECRTPAAPRLFELIESMIEIGNRCRDSRELLRFPRRILECHDHREHPRESRMLPAELYREHEYLRTTSVTELQAWVGHLQRCLAEQRIEMDADIVRLQRELEAVVQSQSQKSLVSRSPSFAMIRRIVRLTRETLGFRTPRRREPPCESERPNRDVDKAA